MREPRSVLTWWDGRVRSLLFDVAVAAVVTWFGVAGHAFTPALVAWGVVAFAGLLVRRRFPLVAVGAAVVVLVFGPNLAPPLVAAYSLASRYGPALRTWIGTAVILAALLITTWVSSDEWDPLSLVIVVFVALPVVAGLWTFQRRTLLAALNDRAEQAERERDLLAERAVTAERRRIAGEMHDVVAHRVSVIALQAGALKLTTDDEHVGKIAEVIRTSSTAALTELRDVLRVLRDDGDAPTPRHSPALHGVAKLVEEFRSAGARVDLALPDVVPETSDAVGRAAYRVVQEALTNAGKHAPGAPVRVEVVASDDAVAVEVTNRDPGGARTPVGATGAGYGLVGMRERVALAGGTVRSGPTDGGGYVVSARFPR
ncbi:sensor histidine kinase [Umezawaea sp. NPDC059074]|uniref:sensor histidine kinase n=1 Tax=Umezawaea sp. NPDC059074 TaxID=3346716 RepID=UPI003691C4DB